MLYGITAFFAMGIFIAWLFYQPLSLVYPLVTIAFILATFVLYTHPLREIRIYTVFFLLGIINWNIHIYTNAISVPQIPQNTYKHIVIRGQITHITSLHVASTGNQRIALVMTHLLPPNGGMHTVHIVGYESTHIHELNWVWGHVFLFPIRTKLTESKFYAQNNYFNGINATGYWIGNMRPIIGQQKQIFGIQQYQRNFQQRIRRFTTASTYGIAEDFMMGKRNDISQSIVHMYRLAALSHLLAISGLHLGLISLLILFFFKRLIAFPLWYIPLPWQQYLPYIFVALLLGIFMWWIHWPVSASRAYFMILFVILGILLRREVISKNSLVFVIFIMLAMDPNRLFQAGFTLSVIATAILIELYSYRSAKYIQYYKPFVKRILFFLASIVCVNLFTMPVLWYYFGYVYPYGLLANIIAIPVMGFWVMPALIPAFLGVIFHIKWLVWPMTMGIYTLNHLAALFTQLPYVAIHLPPMKGMFYSLFLIGFWNVWGKYKYAGIAIISVAVILAFLFPYIHPVSITQANGIVMVRHGTQYNMMCKRRYTKSVQYTLYYWARKTGYAVSRVSHKTQPCKTKGIPCLVFSNGHTLCKGTLLGYWPWSPYQAHTSIVSTLLKHLTQIYYTTF